MNKQQYDERQKQIADLRADRQGYIDGLGADDHSDRLIAAEIRLIDLKLEQLEGNL